MRKNKGSQWPKIYGNLLNVFQEYNKKKKKQPKKIILLPGASGKQKKLETSDTGNKTVNRTCNTKSNDFKVVNMKPYIIDIYCSMGILK
jgi:hypothetical protein